jgi:Ca-activated chloride channel family protein
MRKPLLSLALVAVVASGCATAAGPTNGRYVAPPPEHHDQTPPIQEVPRNTPYDGVTFQDPGVNTFVDPQKDGQSTFGLDVDTASYTVARRFVDDGNLPDPASVRVEEFVNYFDQGYAAPEDGDFAIHVDGGPSPFLAEDEVLLRVGLKAREDSTRARPAASLTFVIDVSGSMARENRLELVKSSLRLLVDGLRRDDSVGIVVFGSDARVVLPPTQARDSATILEAIDALEPEGSTNAEAGLRLGYEMARRRLGEEGINRVILASDGVANVGATDAQTILARIRDDATTGIQLVTVGFGMGNFNDVLLQQLADNGDGFYVYVNNLDEARRLFVENLTGTLESVALDARAQVEFDPTAVEAYRLIGFENRAIDDNAFRDANVNAGAIGAGHASTALYALRLTGETGPLKRIGTVSLRWVEPVSNRPRELARDIRPGDLAGTFRSTGPTFKLDALVAATAERLRGSKYGSTYDLRDVSRAAGDFSEDLPQTNQVHGFLDLLTAAARLER